jgi:hypothetical protein
MVYPALLPLLAIKRTPRLTVFDWNDAPVDLDGLVRVSGMFTVKVTNTFSLLVFSAGFPGHTSYKCLFLAYYRNNNVISLKHFTLISYVIGKMSQLDSLVRSRRHLNPTQWSQCPLIYRIIKHFCNTETVIISSYAKRKDATHTYYVRAG